MTILLNKPPVEESVRFVVKRFASAGKTIARKAAERLVAKIDNIPYYIPSSSSVSKRSGLWTTHVGKPLLRRTLTLHTSIFPASTATSTNS